MARSKTTYEIHGKSDKIDLLDYYMKKHAKIEMSIGNNKGGYCTAFIEINNTAELVILQDGCDLVGLIYG